MSALNTYQIVMLTVAMSLLPVFIWGAIFLAKSKEKRYMIVRTFMIGAVMVVPLVAYRALWDAFPSISLIENLKPLEQTGITIMGLGLNLIALYASIGIIEEYLKHLVVKKVDRHEINSIKDSIEFSIIAALGFSFAENTFYFIQVYQAYGTDMLMQVFIFRSLFSSFAHILFSAVYGYHFGLAIFAKEVYRKESENSFLYKFVYKLYRFLKLKASDAFEDNHRFLGLFFAAGLHAIFNLGLEMGFTVFLIPFLIIGVIHVTYLIYHKDNYIEYK